MFNSYFAYFCLSVKILIENQGVLFNNASMKWYWMVFGLMLG